MSRWRSNSAEALATKVGPPKLNDFNRTADDDLLEIHDNDGQKKFVLNIVDMVTNFKLLHVHAHDLKHLRHEHAVKRLVQ